MTSAIDVSILIPAWDEEDSIGAVVCDSMASCRAANLAAECLVCVDARTSDGTLEFARIAGAIPITQASRGLTAAVLEVAAIAVGSVCVVLDGDGQHDGRGVAALALPILTGTADLVTGVRDPVSLRSGFGGGFRGMLRHAGARLMERAAWLVLRQSVPDPLTGMFASRRADLLALRHKNRIAPAGVSNSCWACSSTSRPTE